LITVPIGPHIPQEDIKEQYPKFCWLMLIFFKPWQQITDLQITDLHTEGQSQPNTCESFMRTCSSNFMNIINNTQLLHEYKDSHNNHFKQQCTRNQSLRLLQDMMRSSYGNNTFCENEQEEILEHINSIENCDIEISKTHKC
jgi:hypothetical protein